MEEDETRQQSSKKPLADKDEEEDEGLDEDDIRRLTAAVVICIIGTLAASGNIFWNLVFFLSIFVCVYYWQTERLNQLPPIMSRHTPHAHTEL